MRTWWVGSDGLPIRHLATVLQSSSQTSESSATRCLLAKRRHDSNIRRSEWFHRVNFFRCSRKSREFCRLSAWLALHNINGLVDEASMHLNYDWRHANRIGKCIHVQFGFEYISEWESIHLFQPSYLSNLYVVITLLASIRHSCAKLAFYCERVTKSFVGQTDKKYRGAIVLHEICDGRGEILGLLE